MLWQLNSRYAESFFKAWNIQARLAWNVHRETHTNIVENYFCEGLDSMRRQILSRFGNFVQKLAMSPSYEIRFLINIVKDDFRSQTCRNIKYVNSLCNEDILKTESREIKEKLPRPPEVEKWRRSLLTTMIEAKQLKTYQNLNLS